MSCAQLLDPFGRAALVLVLVAGLSACEGDEASEDPLPTIENISEDPSQFVGKRAVLAGEVDEVFSDRSFQLKDQTEIIFEDQVLVLTKSPIHLGGEKLKDDDQVLVNGTVRMLEAAEIEKELDWDLSPEIETEFEAQTVVVADSISRLTETARWSEEEPAGTIVGIYSVYLGPDPVELSGRSIDLEAVPVRSVADQGFWVGYEHGSQLFVHSPSKPTVAPGDRVDLSGTLQRMPEVEAALDQFGIDPALSEQVDEELLYIKATTVEKLKDFRAAAK